MIKKINSIKQIIVPAKKINYFVIFLLFLGVILGAVFANIIDFNDKTLVIDKIKIFIDNINTASINSITAFKNSISTNLIYVLVIFILGMTGIGILFNIFLLLAKSFILGFSLASFIITYSYKGIILSSLYLIFGQLLNIIIISLLTIYGIMFTGKLFKLIFKNQGNHDILNFFKNYLIILVFSIIISFLSSLLEVFVFPAIIKIIIKIFI